MVKISLQPIVSSKRVMKISVNIIEIKFRRSKTVTLLNSQWKPDSGMAMSCSGILITRSINALTFAGCKK